MSSSCHTHINLCNGCYAVFSPFLALLLIIKRNTSFPKHWISASFNWRKTAVFQAAIMNIYQRQRSVTVFDRLWCRIFLFTALTDSQEWTPTSSDGVVSSCLCARYKARGLDRENRRKNSSNDPSWPADVRDKSPQWGLSQSFPVIAQSLST